MTPEQQNKLEAIKAALRQHIEEAEKTTPGPWEESEQTGEANAIKHSSGFICFTCAPSKPSDERMDGESWLDMRVRTQPQRDVIEITQESNSAFIASARTMSPLACRMALYAIETMEYDKQEGNAGAYNDLVSILSIWEGGQP